MAKPQASEPQPTTRTPPDYDEYGSEPQQAPADEKPLAPDEALSDPA